VGPSAEVRGRSDARRNRRAVIEAALDVLAERPGASVREVADASGVGRTTVYRHFATREELLGAAVDQLVGEALELSARWAALDAPLGTSLRAIAPEIVALGRRFRFLDAQPALAQDAEARIAAQDPMVARLDAAVALGELAPAPAGWAAATIRALAAAAVGEVLAGRLTEHEAGTVLGETLVRALGARPA
jgi:AcrR family transcriptional regulator